jgi:ClpP class serine protease
MSKQLSFPVLDQIQKIEKLRNSQVIVLAASNLELEILPSLYQQLLNMGKVDRLDVVLHGRGGVVNAARRIALLLRKFTNHLCFIVPYYCESSATILTLAADEIIAGELAVFTPIDPHLQGEGHSEHATPSALSCLDIKMFGEMSKSWFGVDAKEASEQSFVVTV